MNLFSIVWDGVCRRKTRTTLSILGIAVAAAALYSLVALSENYETGMKIELDHSGFHVIAVAKGCPYEAAATAMTGEQLSSSLPEEVVKQIQGLSNIEAAAPRVYGSYHYEGAVFPLVGISSKELELKPGWVIQGRFPENYGEVVLGSGTAAVYARQVEEDEFWRWWSPCCFGLSPDWDVRFQEGNEIELGDILQGVTAAGETVSFEVTGILEKTGSRDDFSTFTTLETAQDLLDMKGRIAMVNIKVTDTAVLPETIENLRGIPDVQAVTASQVMGALQNMIQTGEDLLFTVMLAALLMGGLGTMNTMLMAVFERTREIGMMKAVGASRRKIFQLFLLEGALICLVGAGIGTGAGWAVSSAGNYILNLFVSVVPSYWTGQVSWHAAGISVGLPLLVGMLSTLYPAYRASRLSPMEALRSEEGGKI